MCHNKKSILVVIVAHNEMEYVKLNVQVLLSELNDMDGEIVIVDNCSNDGLQEWLLQQKNVSYIICDEKAEEYGYLLRTVIEQFGSERDVLLCSANYVFVSGSIAYMQSALYSQSNIAAVGPVSNGLPGEQKYLFGNTSAEILNYRNCITEDLIETAYLDTDVMLLKRNTLEALETEHAVPQAVMRGYMKNILRQGAYLAVARKAICFTLGSCSDELYRVFHPYLYQHEKIHQLLYRFGDIAYKGIYLYKYLKPEILMGMNQRNRFQNLEKNSAFRMWNSDDIYLSTETQAEHTLKVIENLPQKQILFVTLPIRRLYQGQFIHTAIESFISSIDENNYLDLEYIASFNEEYELNIPTKNRYPIIKPSIPKIYGIENVEKQELLEFIYLNYIQPIERILGFKFDENILVHCLMKASNLLRERTAYMKFYRKVIEQVKPKVIIYSHGQDPMLTYLRDTALEMGIPTLEIAHGVELEDTYHKQLVYADDIVAYSGIIAKKSKEQGNNRVFGLGKPGVYDHILKPEYKYPTIVISFISSAENEILQYAKNLARRLNKEKYWVVYKCHGVETWTEEEQKQIEKEVGNLQFIEGACDIREIAEASDIVVGIRSSGIFDVMPYSMVKIIAIKDIADNFDEANPNTILQQVADSGDIVMVDDEEQLYQEVMSYRRNMMYRNNINNFWPVDAGEQFRKLVESYL